MTNKKDITLYSKSEERVIFGGVLRDIVVGYVYDRIEIVKAKRKNWSSS